MWSQQNKQPEIQAKLLRLWEEKKEEEFRKECSKLVNDHAEFFKVMDLHSGSGSSPDVSRDEFVNHFKSCFRVELSNALFSTIAGDKNTCKVVNIRTYFHGRRTVIKQKEVVKDAVWLSQKLQKMNLKDIDDDENLKIEREELRAHLKEEVDVVLIDAIFDSIDADHSGQITPLEFFKWRHNTKIDTIQKIMVGLFKKKKLSLLYVQHTSNK
ncbi:hypothetical protein RFI_03403 [Reticulomyxa filosa]|uniref:EF-hand domain-containing protein n=1 Tax=Reticulomyxa filosa TaxID=46433 RepID=X6P6F7_RETFI|nr:hypothetical protein RFI_03403 [Reticulomyxa filosa]|eukprot:ETO33698.1 hypothetical protein RFI_03403 [Reticulomyxa filosa]